MMLAIETSSRPFSVAVGEHEGSVFEITENDNGGVGDDLSLLVEKALGMANLPLDEIRVIAVSIGPGGLGATRAGVAFANALGFSLGVPIWPVSSFVLLGHEIWLTDACPAICLANAADGKCYGGLYDGEVCRDAAVACGFGHMDDVLSDLLSNISNSQKIIVAGRKSAEGLQKLHALGIKFPRVAEIERPLASAAFRLRNAFKGGCPGASKSPALPLNEQAPMFQASPLSANTETA